MTKVLRLSAMRLGVQRAFVTLRAAILAVRERWHAYERAEARGLALLQYWLSAEQLSQLRQSRFFDVIGSESGRRYRICYGTSTNVYELNEAGRTVMGWCFRPVGSLVAGDVMLAQKVALETDERAALMVAQPFPSSLPPRTGNFMSG